MTAMLWECQLRCGGNHMRPRGLTVLGDACFLDKLSSQLPSLPNQAFDVLELSCPQFLQALSNGPRNGGVAGKFLQIDPRLLE